MSKMTQFEKRKAKSSPEDDLVKRVEDKIVEMKAPAVLTQTALDVYTLDGGKTYGVAEIAYDPTTKEAKVTETYSITRLVALKQSNMKVALSTLKRKLIKKEE